MNRQAYIDECALRWHGECLTDARQNWKVFEEHREELTEIIRVYLHDNNCETVSGKMLNPDGTLTAWLWHCSTENPWIWDFCEHYQQCHLRRGLIAYAKQLIADLKVIPIADADGQLEMVIPMTKGQA